MVLAALLTGLAWWLSHRRAPRAHEATHASTTEPAPWLVWSSPPITSRDATTIVDTSIASDAGPSTEARDHLGALLVAQICARRDECLCGAYPSPYAEGHETATTCEADVMRDFLRWWSERVTTPVVLVDEAELLEQVDLSVGCTGTRAHVDAFVRADAVDGEPCGDELTCRDGASCVDGLCEGTSSLGEPCTDIDAWEPRTRYCDEDLRCLRGRCAQRLPEGARCDPERNECSEGLTCDHRRCERLLQEGDACQPGSDCDGYRLECIDGRCVDPEPLRLRCERPTLRRWVGQHREDDNEAPEECIPFGTPCQRMSDCGWGVCEGEGSWLCDTPGPHASIRVPIRRSPGVPTCRPEESCFFDYGRECECPPGQSCGEVDDARRCRPDVARGGSCRGRLRECAEGLDCDLQVPVGGRCVGFLCMQTRFFP